MEKDNTINKQSIENISMTREGTDDSTYSNITIIGKNIRNIMNVKTPYAFVDGSFNEKTKVYGYGGFVATSIDKKDNKVVLKDIHFIEGNGNDPDMATMRNVAGEILGAKEAIKKAVELGLKEINIYYDYDGIEKWVTKEWKRNSEFTKDYHEFVNSLRNIIKINFIKVKAHKGIVGNEWADILSKRASGVLSNIMSTEEIILSEFNMKLDEVFNKILHPNDASSINEGLDQLISSIIDIFEDFLDEKHVEIDNEDKEGEETEAIIYGNDYDDLRNSIESLIKNWYVVIKK